MQSELHSGNRRAETERRRKALQTLVSHHGRRCTQGMRGCACAHTMFPVAVSTLANMWTIVMKTQSQCETTGPLTRFKRDWNNKELHSPKERKLISLTQDWSVRVCPCLWSLFWDHHLGNQCPPTAWRSGLQLFQASEDSKAVQTCFCVTNDNDVPGLLGHFPFLSLSNA